MFGQAYTVLKNLRTALGFLVYFNLYMQSKSLKKYDLIT